MKTRPSVVLYAETSKGYIVGTNQNLRGRNFLVQGNLELLFDHDTKQTKHSLPVAPAFFVYPLDTIFSNQSLEKQSSAKNEPIVINITIIIATLSRMTPVLP